MMHDFHMSEAYVLDELPIVRAFAYRAWATEANPWGKVDRLDTGYIGQEIDRLSPTLKC